MKSRLSWATLGLGLASIAFGMPRTGPSWPMPEPDEFLPVFREHAAQFFTVPTFWSPVEDVPG